MQATEYILRCESGTLTGSNGKYQPFFALKTGADLPSYRPGGLQVAGHGGKDQEEGHMGARLYLISFKCFPKGALPNFLDVG